MDDWISNVERAGLEPVPTEVISEYGLGEGLWYRYHLIFIVFHKSSSIVSPVCSSWSLSLKPKLIGIEVSPLLEIFIPFL
jgi:hypothetical protein